MIKILHLDQFQQIRVVDVERRFSKQEGSEVSFIRELFAELGIHGVDRLAPEEVVATKWKASLDIGNTQSLPLAEVLGDVAVEDEEEDEEPEHDLQQHPCCVR